MKKKDGEIVPRAWRKVITDDGGTGALRDLPNMSQGHSIKSAQSYKVTTCKVISWTQVQMCGK